MKKVLFLAVALISGLAGVLAGERSDSELKALALRQLGKSARLMSPAAADKVAGGGLNLQRTLSVGNVVAYSADGVGSVFLSADDRCIPVLGYTAAVVKDGAELPCGLKWWIEEMDRQFKEATESRSAASSPVIIETSKRAAATPVAPLVTTYWNQDVPYNSQCPIAAGGQAITGCVATTIAQLLNYNKYPTSAQFDSGYYLDDSEEPVLVTVNSTYTYPYKDAYGAYYPDGQTNASLSGYSPAQGRAVGELMRDCGYAAVMTYSAEVSGASVYGAAQALRYAFKYPEESVKYMDRMYYSDAEWYNAIYDELAKGSPVYFAAVDATAGGHAFVVDGVDADGLIHVNWGWSGLYNGYYSMEVMDPGNYKFTSNQRMFVGIRPTPLADDKYNSLWLADGYEFVTGAMGTTCSLSLDAGFTLQSIGLSDFSGCLCVVAADNDNPEDINVCGSFYEFETGLPCSFGGGLSSQTAQSLDFTMAMQKVMQRGHTYRVYLASISNDELAASEVSLMRQVGGIGYYLIEYGANGKFSVKGNSIESGISSVAADKTSASGRTFNISGNEVGESFKGIVIKDGKKFIRK